MKAVFFVFTFLVINTGYSQLGEVTFHADPRVDAMIKKLGTPVPPNICPQIVGYRIQLIFDGNKSTVDQSRSKFVSVFPKIDTYINFESPYYLLKAGDFRTRAEAEKVKSEIEDAFPTSFIIKEMINLPRID